jgi:uncharacterized protein (TIGR03546 family)
VILWTFRQVYHLRNAIKGQDTARQLAFGCALGMLFGLLPKGNLLALGISVIILCTRVNLGTAALCAFGFSLLGVHLDALTHLLGRSVLTYEPLMPLWRTLYAIPLVPWTSFNNTVVMGSFVLGSLLFYPVYRLSLSVCQRWRDRLARDDEARAAGEAAASKESRALLNAGLVASSPAGLPLVVQAAAPVAWVESRGDSSPCIPAVTVSTHRGWQRFDAANTPLTAPRLQASSPLHWESTIPPSSWRDADGREATAR